MKIIVKDKDEPTLTYCILTCIDMPVEKLQTKINDIITQYKNSEWTYDEIFDDLPEEWNVEYEPLDLEEIYI